MIIIITLFFEGLFFRGGDESLRICARARGRPVRAQLILLARGK